jgi:hypothetical protein
MQVNDALLLLGDHVRQHSDNKYQHSVLDTEKPLQEPRFTLLTAQKYMARYLASKGEKLADPQDLLKAAHFILFEIQNRLNTQPPATYYDLEKKHS